jgi:hypothetical protein
MDEQLIFSRRYNLTTEEERETKLSKYPLIEQINDLQQIEICSNEITSETNKTIEEVKNTCQGHAKLILGGSPTIAGLTSKSPNGNLRRCYQEIIRSYIRIIWKQRCDEALKERSDLGMPLNETKKYKTPLPDFPEEKLQ